MKWFFLVSVSTAVGTGLLMTQDPYSGGASSRRVRDSRPVSADTPEADVIFASGVVEGSRRDVPLQFEIPGRLVSLAVSEGDRVRKGDLLARLNDAVWQHKLSETQARLALARAERTRLHNAASPEARAVARTKVLVSEVRVRQAQADLGRGQLLVKKHAMSDREWDDVRFAYSLALAELESARAAAAQVEAKARKDVLDIADAKIALAEAEVGEATSQLAKARIVAPFDGIILHVAGETGQLIGPTRSEPLITMTSIDTLRVRAFIEEMDVLGVAVGQQVWITADGDKEKRHRGTILSCAPFMVPKRTRSHKPTERVDVKVREVVIILQGNPELVIGLPVDVFIRMPAGTRPHESSTTPEKPAPGSGAPKPSRDGLPTLTGGRA